MQQTVDTPSARTRPMERAGTTARGRRIATPLWVPGARHLRLDRALRWALVAASIGLLLLGINP
jgi:hypothetical protein